MADLSQAPKASTPSWNLPRQGAGPALRPLTWRLQEPLPQLQPPSAAPLLVQIDCREPLPHAVRDYHLKILSASEQKRLHSFRSSTDRERFLRSRGGLRRLLASWLGCPPSKASIEIGALGKPFCPGGPQFNLSHSGDLILIALHPCYQVGVDLEELRPGLDWHPIAERVLTNPQRQTLSRLPAKAQLGKFLAEWCALEAQLKAAGSGFSGFERLRGPAVHGNQQPLHIWRLRLTKGYLGAAALCLSQGRPKETLENPA